LYKTKQIKKKGGVCAALDAQKEYMCQEERDGSGDEGNGGERVEKV
jgi:hypothetical protein